jgi:uridine kinase
MIRRTLIIGIAGGSASGKSTFAEVLVQTLSQVNSSCTVQVFQTDTHFYHDKLRGPRFWSASAGEEQCNHPESADNARLLADVQARAAATDAPQVILIEGLMVLHEPTIREWLDLRLFIELDADERALRRLLRNMSKGQEPAAIATYYRECARVGHARFVEPSRVHADFILRGDADFTRLSRLVAEMVEGRLRQLASNSTETH